MILKNIKIKNFRNYSDLSLTLNEGINILFGNNGEGKTNLLESIYVLSFTKSHRSFIDNNLIKNGCDTAIIKGTILKEMSYNLEIILNKSTKKVKIDHNEQTKIGDYIEKTNIVIFYAEDMELIKGMPDKRRKYINMELSQLSNNYFKVINDFNKILKSRNECLKKMNSKEYVDEKYFDILTDYFIEKSIFIIQMRSTFIKKLNKICPEIFKKISNLNGFNIKYKTNIKYDDYEKDTIRTNLKAELAKNKEREIYNKVTLYGPNRDDFEFLLNDLNLKQFGSQGQQRMAILALKLSEIKIIKDYKKSNPIVLLDDVFSELDDNKKNNLLNFIDDDIQTIITTTDLNNIDKKIVRKSKLIEIKNGKIINGEVK